MSAAPAVLLAIAAELSRMAKDSMPKMREGEILAVLSTGAYNYSMASNYNRNSVPPVVMAENGKSYLCVKKQDFNDLVRNDL